MPSHFGKPSLHQRVVLRGLTRNMHTTYAIIMEEKGREQITHLIPVKKIISSTPGVGDHHGCPYRHFSEENLRVALVRMGVSSRAVEDVMDKVRNRHYQLACTLTFEAVHGSSCDAGINHPNQYFIDSQRILQSKNGSGHKETLFRLCYTL